jgi:ribosome maturation factor RimP
LSDFEKTKALIENIVSSEGLDLVEVEIKGSLNRRIVRIFIDKPEGITHADCERISHQVGAELDIEDLIPGSYTLEVSSPGLTRKLQSKEDFLKFRGRLVKIQMHQPVEGSRTIRGILAAFDGETVTVELKKNAAVQFPFHWVAKANLDIDI